jgi:hypothetical protein
VDRVAKAVAGIGILLGCAALCLVPAAGAATLQDTFAARETVKAAPVTATGSNVGAGREAGEPVPNTLSPAGHTVWLGWEAPSSAYYTFSTCDSSIATVLAFYVGSEVDKLSEQQSQANFGGPECSPIRNGITSLFLTGGKVQVMVDGNNFFVPPAPPPVTEGPLTLKIEKTPPAPNDDFEDAAVLTGKTSEEPDGTRFYFGDQFGYNYNATKQTGEPNHAGDSGGSSVWYTWTAPESGVAHFTLCCGTVNLLGVYTGEAVNALVPVKSGKTGIDVPVTAGTTYEIAVDSEFSFFLGGTFDDKFDLLVGMKLAPGPGSAAGGGAPETAPDLTPPQTTITRGVLRRMPPVFIFRFRSSEPGSTFRCSLDRRRFASCGSSRVLKKPLLGRHRLRVYAIDSAGNADPTPAVARFRFPVPHTGSRGLVP